LKQLCFDFNDFSLVLSSGPCFGENKIKLEQFYFNFNDLARVLSSGLSSGENKFS
jgi:hypothetical protein